MSGDLGHNRYVDFDLSRLGSSEFDDLCRALARDALGKQTLAPRKGPDGGQKAIFEGCFSNQNTSLSPDLSSDPWVGSVFLHVIFAADSDKSTGQAWLIREIKSILKKQKSLMAYSSDDYYRPDYFIFATNVHLAEEGVVRGIDKVDRAIEKYVEDQGFGIKGWSVWHYGHICELLEKYSQVKNSYAAFLAPGDVLAALREILSATIPDIDEIVINFVAKELIANQWVRLGQAGHVDNQKLFLGAVAIDLPAQESRNSYESELTEYQGVAAHIVRSDTRIRKPSIRGAIKNFVLVGGPGQGKSTITEIIAQAYRVELLRDRPAYSLGSEAARVRDRMAKDLADIGIQRPFCRRIPIKIALSEYADALAEDHRLSLLRHLTRLMGGDTDIEPRDVKALIRNWPCLIILDGLDEVSTPAIRSSMLRYISEFLVDAAGLDADLLVVGTTRPQGYSQEFEPDDYQHYLLTSLHSEQAIAYATRLADVRHHNDPNLHKQVLERVEQASRQALTARLMSSPLQVTIMSLLLERRKRAPQDRYALFEAYYNTLYERESNKQISIADELQNQRANVDYLHEYVGLGLQVKGERIRSEYDAIIRIGALRDLAKRRLIDEGFEERSEKLASKLVKAATERLVLLVPKGLDGIGFEIRSLQELMAARALTNGRHEDVLQRLEDLIPSAHWRNVWLFAASRIFGDVQSQYLRDALLMRLEAIDSADLLYSLVVPGARVALEMLEHDVAAKSPMYQRLLAKRALRLLDFHPRPVRQGGEAELTRVARILFLIGSEHRQTRELITTHMKRACMSRGPAAISALSVAEIWANDVGSLAVFSRQLLSGLDRRYDDGVVRQLRGLKHFGNDLKEYVGSQQFGQLQEILEAQNSAIMDELLSFETMQLIGRVVEEAPASCWTEAAKLREVLISYSERCVITADWVEDIAVID